MTHLPAIPAEEHGRPVRRITLCCGGHERWVGDPSRCTCCAECVTNSDVEQQPPEARAAQARDARAANATWSRAARGAIRHLEVLLLRQALDGIVRPLDRASRSAATLPQQPERPDLPELDRACLMRDLCDGLSPWFTKPLVAS